MPVNVLYIIDSLTHGGTEKQLVQLIRYLDPEKFRPHLCTLKSSEGLYEELEIPKLCLDFVSFGRPAIVPKVAALAAFIRQHRIKIVETFFQDPFLLGAMVKPFTGVKLIGAFRDLGFWRTAAETRKMRLAYPFFSGFIANSQAVKEHFVQRDGIRAEKIEVIYNGLDLGVFVPKSPEDFGQEKFVIGIVANLNRPVKRVQDFILAAAIIRNEIPSARFVVVGDGHLRGGLEEMAHSLGLNDAITFTGRIENPAEILKNLHVGVITSETEGLCNAIIEYMACGLPVVATAVGGNPELVVDGENGYLVPSASPQELADKIVQLARDLRLCREMGERNAAKVQSLFPIAAMVAHQGRFYQSLMAQ